MTSTPSDIWAICQECARAVQPHKPETHERVARLLFGTAAQESHLTYRRQISRKTNKPMRGYGGAFSLWQFECGSVGGSLITLKRSPNLSERVSAFCLPAGSKPVHEMTAIEVLNASLENDRLACIFSRLHYLRVPSEIPKDLMEQAWYWKLHYNTLDGAGTVDQYIKNWQALCEPVVRENVDG